VKTTDLMQVPDKLYHRLYQVHLALGWNETHGLRGERLIE